MIYERNNTNCRNGKLVLVKSTILIVDITNIRTLLISTIPIATLPIFYQQFELSISTLTINCRYNCRYRQFQLSISTIRILNIHTYLLISTIGIAAIAHW